eukprot:6181041-Pleurochrysis_carterae.AAC.2
MLPAAEQEAAVLATMELRTSERVKALADVTKQQAYFKLKREQALQRQLDKLVSEYTKALAAFDKNTASGRGAPMLTAVRAKLAKLRSETQQHAFSAKANKDARARP